MFNFKSMLVSLRSPLGGQPLRLWAPTTKRGVSSLDIAEEAEAPRIDKDSYYCVKIGYYEDGEEVLIRDKEAFLLYKLLKKHYSNGG